MSLRYINNNGEEISIAGQGLPGRDGEGIHVGTILAYNGLNIPDGYEQVEDPIAALRREIYEAMWPIGRGFIDFTDTDYSNWLGFTWKRELVGMTPIGKDTNDTDFATVGQKGGSKTHTLTVDEMPSHTHTQNAHCHKDLMWGDGSNQYFGVNDYGTNTSNATKGTWKFTYTSTASEANFYTNYVTATNQNTGGGQAHSIMQPYQVVSYWKRIDPNAKTMISFTMWGITYQAEEGMTFAEWVPSEYNTDGWYYPSEDSLALINPRGNIIDYADITASAKPTDIIENGKAYSTYTEK